MPVDIPVLVDCDHRSGLSCTHSNVDAATWTPQTCYPCKLRTTVSKRVVKTPLQPEALTDVDVPCGWIPELDETEIIYVHFNPCDYKRPVENVFEWWNSLCDLRRITRGVHLVFRDDEPVLPNAERIKATAGQFFFAKEALINWAARRSTKRYIAWVDADIIYPSQRWLKHGLKLLAHYDAVQLFEAVDYPDANGTVSQQRGRAANRMRDKRSLDGNPGVAWLMRRETFTAIGGLPELNIVGAGDVAAFDAWTQKERATYWNLMGQDARDYWRDYKGRCLGVIHRLAYVPCTPVHLYHGDRQQRYANRQEIVRGLKRADLQISDNGLPEIVNQELLDAVRDYMHRRQEDA